MHQDNYKNIFNAYTDAVVIHTVEGELLEFNKEFVELTGLATFSIKFYELFDFNEEQKQDITARICHQKNAVVIYEASLTTTTEVSVPVEIKSKTVVFNSSSAILTIIRDISNRKALEKQLLNTIVETEEKERQRLAIDLHDEIGPLLSSMKMYMQLLKNATDSSKMEYINNQLLDLVKEAITATREISNSLSPHVLSNYGLIPAMSNMMDNIRPFIPVTFKTNCDSIRFEDNVETVYYRIFKELCNNTLKHSKAKNIDIALKFANGTLYLHYSDDGIGFELDEKLNSKKDGIGLFNILSRVQAINGEYQIATSKGNGFNFELKAKVKMK